MSASPRLAASVVVLRPSAVENAGERAPEILMVRRSRGASFMADAFVFPGGRVDEADLAEAGADGPRALRLAAARELREEAAVTVDPEALVALSRWITPSAEPKRFDASFFLAVVPAGTEARVDADEVTEHVWGSASLLLSRHAASALKLPPPMLRMLEELARPPDLASLLAWAGTRPQAPILPKLVSDEDGLLLLLPWDAAYPGAPGEGTPIGDESALSGGSSRYRHRDGYFRAD